MGRVTWAEEAAGHQDSRQQSRSGVGEGHRLRGPAEAGTASLRDQQAHLCASSRHGCWRPVPTREGSEAEGRTPGEVGSGSLALLRAVPSPQCRQAIGGSPWKGSRLCHLALRLRPAPAPPASLTCSGSFSSLFQQGWKQLILY